MANAQIRGLEDVISMIERMEQQIETKVEQAVKETTLKAEADAKMLAPVDTGRLRQSIVSEFINSGSKFQGKVSTSLEYAIYVEFGTSRQGAQPFMTPAFNANKSELIEKLKRIIEEVSK